MSGVWPSSSIAGPPLAFELLFDNLAPVRTWEATAPDFGRPIAAPPDQYAELLDVDPATIREVAANVEPYLR